jgi:hypothetical protein
MHRSPHLKTVAMATACCCVLIFQTFSLAATQYQISVVTPAYASDISRDTAIVILAPGLTSVTPRCWKADAGLGHDSVFAAIALDNSGNGQFRFPASLFPHGPLCIRLLGSGTGHSDTCFLGLYNTGGISWSEGLGAAPAQAAGLPLLFADDFTAMPTISGSGAGATYHAHTKGGKDFSTIPFTDPTGVNNPFSQRDNYLRIRADAVKNSTGFISTIREDGTGLGVLYG